MSKGLPPALQHAEIPFVKFFAGWRKICSLFGKFSRKEQKCRKTFDESRPARWTATLLRMRVS
ncbi:hypothetical protein PQU92_05705 [Asticcacaulis sp. BYS171W]|uniref:Transposase n=1 Tax=Asticcacaulis aquaticus TaxID=2984212 RepID=A0ABT5HS47_9CAUL|nr:hypothetical protein [Asticcacaulis aquaticus]MDC7682762.1 hypothetical protein [Asticcacaulis aquaticus]